MRESTYQHSLKKRIEERLPGCYVLKNDPNWIQGIPDLTILYKDKWATLEVKRSEDADHQTNQDWYVNDMQSLSFSAFIFPENEKEILDELQRTLQS